MEDTFWYIFLVKIPVPVQFSDLRLTAKSCEKKTRMPYKLFLIYIDIFTYGFGLINGKRPNRYDAWLNSNMLQYIDHSTFL
jgi:hypothetical protein